MREPDPDFDRFRTAVMGGTPDRVPLAEVLVDEEIKEQFLGERAQDVAADVRFWREAGYDYIMLGRRLVGLPPFWDRATTDTYYEIQAQRPPSPHEKGIIGNWRDFHDYPWMKPGDMDLSILDAVEAHLPDGMKVVRYIGAVFQAVWMLMGFETFSYALRDDPSLVRAMFEKLGDLVMAEFEDALARDCVGAIWYLDDVAFKSGLMVRPSVLREYQFPIMREMAARCRERRLPFLYHTDGNVEEIIPELIEMGVCALHPLESVSVDIYEMKQRYGDRLCLMGNIDLASVLATGTVEEVVEDTREHLRRLAPGGGYCLGSSNSVTLDVPLANYRAMIDTVMQYGKYPISV